MYNKNLNKMTQEQLRMQMLAGIITENEISDITSKWAATDKAQLDYYEENGPKNIQVGDNNFEIRDYFMDNNNVPTIEIMNSKTRSLHYLPLSVVWDGYQNYSALGDDKRKELMNKYNLD